MAGIVNREGAQVSRDVDLAAGLLWRMGANVPHDPRMDEVASSLIPKFRTRSEVYQKAAELCRYQYTAQAMYLSTVAYSLMGPLHEQDVVRCAERFLQCPPWSGTDREAIIDEGIRKPTADLRRGEVLMALATAECATGSYLSALVHQKQAYQLMPYSGQAAVRTAEILRHASGAVEALSFLKDQRESTYYPALRYVDVSGRERVNDSFSRAVEAELTKWGVRE